MNVSVVVVEARGRGIARNRGSISVLVAAWLFPVLLFAVWLLFAVLHVRESEWPWTDQDKQHGWLHGLNETGRPVAWGWRSEGVSDWNYIWAEWDHVSPEPSKWRSEREVGRMLPGLGPGKMMFRVELADGGLATAELNFTPGMHVRLRAAADGRVSVATGSATAVGYASFGPERSIDLRSTK